VEERGKHKSKKEKKEGITENIICKFGRERKREEEKLGIRVVWLKKGGCRAMSLQEDEEGKERPFTAWLVRGGVRRKGQRKGYLVWGLVLVSKTQQTKGGSGTTFIGVYEMGKRRSFWSVTTTTVGEDNDPLVVQLKNLLDKGDQVWGGGALGRKSGQFVTRMLGSGEEPRGKGSSTNLGR